MLSSKSICLAIVMLLSIASTGRAEGRKFAVLVGVNTYRGTSGLPQLRHAAQDANSLAVALKSAGFTVYEMTHESASKPGNETLAPNLAYIRDQIEGMLAFPNLGAEDAVVISLHGHGVQFEHVDEKGEKTPRYYFCPADATIAGVQSANDVKDRNQLLPLEELYAQLGVCKASTKLLIVDACRNDPTQPGVFRSGLASATLPKLPPPPGGTAAFFSCKANQQAVEDPALQQGVFTHFLVQGLLGKADQPLEGKPADGIITFSELSSYVANNTYSHVYDRYKIRQSPELRGDYDLNLPLARVSASTPKIAPRHAPGSLDQTFGDRGRTFINFGYGGSEDAYALALQRDGKIVAAGEVEKGLGKGQHYLAICRLNSDGSLDDTFDGDGKTVLNFGPFDDGLRGPGLAIQTDGKIIVGGRAEMQGWGHNFGLVRLLPDGRLDTTFGNKGSVNTDLTGRQTKEVYSSTLQAIGLQSDGRIIATGTAAIRSQTPNQIGVAAVRYLTDGRLDTSFGRNGWVVTDLKGNQEELLDMTLLSDGRIVTVGSAGPVGDKDGFVVRYTRNGASDTSFNNNGVKYLNLGPGSNDVAFGVATQGDKLLVLINGDAAKSSVVIRLLADGQLDQSFGPDRNGLTVLGIPAMGLKTLPDGRILVANQSNYSVTLLSASGLIESTTLATSGGSTAAALSSSLTTPSASPRKEVARILVKAPSGQLVFGGQTVDASGRSLMTIVRAHGVK